MNATVRETIAIGRATALSAIEDLIRRLLEDAEGGPAVSTRAKPRRSLPPNSHRAHLIRLDDEIAHLRAQIADTAEYARIKRRLDEILPLRAAMAAIDAGERGDA